MFRRSLSLLGGGLVEYHEWQLHEPLLINYEGWRILDDVPMTNWEAYVTDLAGIGRHLDPIIDDPRLTHSQRVCRLYRWALKEYHSYIRGALIGQRANIAYKVIRLRFEKYRYVTDPATCDMMVRVTQKYLRETCMAGPVYLRRNPASPYSNLCGSNPMFHPDNCLVYDHWTQVETFWYDDAKLHRYSGHHPLNAGAGEISDRFGSLDEVKAAWQRPTFVLSLALILYTFLHFLGVLNLMTFEDPNATAAYNKHFNHDLQLAIAAEERNRRAFAETSALNHKWAHVVGSSVSPATEGMTYLGMTPSLAS